MQKRNKQIIKNQNECPDELLKTSFNMLYQYNLTYLFGHILIGIESFFLGAYILSVVNIISVLWFSYNAYKMKTTPIEKYNISEIRMTIEIILHQIIAFCLVGSECGFQYILLACSCTLFTLYKNDNSKSTYILKAFLMIILFVFIEIYGRSYIPVYSIEPNLAKIWAASTISYSFMVTAYFTLKSYTSVILSLEKFKKESIEKNNKIQTIQKKVIIGMANIIENRDGSTGEHTKRTVKYVEKLVKELLKDPNYKDILTDEFVNNLKMSAPLHDIGKIKIPDSILQKPDKLTDEEYLEIKKHSEYGGNIIKETIDNIEDKNYINVAYNVATYHHERWDGKGYPYGLSGEEIPLEARIMAIADVYDALTTKRCYKDAFSNEEALRIIEDGIETQFDPKLSKIFIKLMRE